MIRFFIAASILFLAFGGVPTAQAQHPLSFVPEGSPALASRPERQSQQVDEAKTFTGPIERLLDMAGEDSSDSPHWKNFEDISGTPAEERYHSTFQWQMEKENNKPIERKKSFNSTLDDVGKYLEGIKPTNARQQREHQMDHY